MNENENSIHQNLCDAVKVVLTGKITASNAYVKNQERSEINNLPLQLKKLENKEQLNSKLSEGMKYYITAEMKQWSLDKQWRKPMNTKLVLQTH